MAFSQAIEAKQLLTDAIDGCTSKKSEDGEKEASIQQEHVDLPDQESKNKTELFVSLPATPKDKTKKQK